jgi:hypothetical protein
VTDDHQLLKDVIRKSYRILSTSSDIGERSNAQDTIDRLIDLLGKQTVADLTRELLFPD